MVNLSSETPPYLRIGYITNIRTDVRKDWHPVIISRKEILEAPRNKLRVLLGGSTSFNQVGIKLMPITGEEGGGQRIEA